MMRRFLVVAALRLLAVWYVGVVYGDPATAIGSATTQTAQAELYNVDFGPDGTAYAGRGLLGGVADHFWNKLASPQASKVSLKKSDGSDGAATLSSAGFAGAWQHPGINNLFGWENFGDYWFVKKGISGSLILANLPAGSSYTLLVYAMPGAGGRVMEANVDGGTAQQTSGNEHVWEFVNWVAAPGKNANYLKFTGTVPPSRSITLSISAVGTDVHGDIQGLQIQIRATEPPSATLGPKGVGYGSLVKNLKAGRDQVALFVGTSLTAGCSWPTALQSALANKYEGRLIISNRAIAATASNSGVSHIADWLKEDHPDAVFIEYGINDAWLPASISLDQSRANLDTMVAAIHKANADADIILLTMDNPIDRHLAARPDVEKYYQGYRDYAAAQKMTLIDDYPLWKKLYDTDPVKWKSYVPDGIHPNFEGNRAVVLDNMVRTLEQAGAAKTAEK